MKVAITIEDEIRSRIPGAPWLFTHAGHATRVSTRTLERAAEAGQLRVIRIGKRKFIPDSEVKRIFEEGLSLEPAKPVLAIAAAG